MAPARIDTPSTEEDSCFSPVNGHFNGVNGGGDGAHTAPIEDKLEPIVIVGMDLRFPQDATSPEEFWEMLSKGRSAMSPVPETRWDVNAFYHPDPEGQELYVLTSASRRDRVLAGGTPSYHSLANTAL
jgi:hypothetical protein